LNRNKSQPDPNEVLGFWCAKCPAGADCTLRGTTLLTVKAKPGYFTGLDGSNTSFFPCLNEKACTGGEEKCAPGYAGHFCTDCAAGMVLSTSFKCGKCIPKGGLIALIILFFFVCIGLLVWLVRDIHSDARKGVNLQSTFFKIVASAFQVNATAIAFAFDWDQMLESMLTVQSTATSFGYAYFNLACLVTNLSSPFFSETMVFAVAPPLFILAGYGLVWVVAKLNRMNLTEESENFANLNKRNE